MDPVAILRDFLLRQAGLVLQPGQEHFALTRLAPVMRQAGLNGLPSVAERIEGGDHALGRAVVEAMVTHETSFFRDRPLFTFMEDVMFPSLHFARAEERRLRIWSGACSTGQEPYSIAMLLDEMAREFTGWWIEITATDLSGKAIEKARRGRYSQFEVQRGLSAGRLLRYFSRVGDDWQVAEHLQERIRFGEFNLLGDPADFGPCDIFFCRNVFLYFDAATTRAVLERLAGIIAPDGYLVVGGAETLLGLSDLFIQHPRQPGVLVRRPAENQKPALKLATG